MTIETEPGRAEVATSGLPSGEKCPLGAPSGGNMLSIRRDSGADHHCSRATGCFDLRCCRGERRRQDLFGDVDRSPRGQARCARSGWTGSTGQSTPSRRGPSRFVRNRRHDRFEQPTGWIRNVNGVAIGLAQVEAGFARDCLHFSNGRYAEAEQRAKAVRDISLIYPLRLPRMRAALGRRTSAR